MGVIAASAYLLIRNGNNLESPRWISESERHAVRETSAPRKPLVGRETANPQETEIEHESPNQQAHETTTTGEGQAGTTQIDSDVGIPPVTASQSTDHLKSETSSPKPASSGQAIQLAENFRLPASTLIQGVNRNSPFPMVSPAISAATQEIENSFYRALAATPPETGQTPQGIPPDAIENEDTRLIPPTAETERLRIQADQWYRTLFGDAAYNQQTMNSLIEVRLPPLPATDWGK